MKSKVWDVGGWREPTERENGLIALVLLGMAAFPIIIFLGIIAEFVGYKCDQS